jgi:DNA-binding NarL/FixJ family response regulator
VVAQLLGGQPTRLASLTARERGGAGADGRGPHHAAIAGTLFVTEKAVGKHINNVFRKLDLVESPDDNRRVLAVLAVLAYLNG